MRRPGGHKDRLSDLVEFPEESLAHHIRRARRNCGFVWLALLDLPEQRLLPNIRGQSLPRVRPGLKRRLRNLLRFNSHLSLSRNETNTNPPRTKYPNQKARPIAQDIKAVSSALNIATKER
jgi:hypothetical protein